MVLLPLGQFCGCSDSYDRLPEQSIPTQWLVSEPLWNAASEDLEDWQILVHPRQIVSGEHGDMFVSDSGNSRVVRVSESGSLIETIGRFGEGPGEFREPWDLAYDRKSNLLWVGDRAAGRIVVFDVGDSSSIYLESLPAPSIMGGSTSHGLFPISEDSVWVASQVRDFRIYCLSRSGEVLAARLGREPVTSMQSGMVSNDHLIAVGWNRFWTVDVFSPEVYIWDSDGDVIESVPLALPEVVRHQERQVDANARKWYVGAYGVDVDRTDVFLQIYFDPRLLVVYQFEAAQLDINPRRRYASEMRSDRLIVSFTPVHTSGGVVLYALDDREGVVIRLRNSSDTLNPYKELPQ